MQAPSATVERAGVVTADHHQKADLRLGSNSRLDFTDVAMSLQVAVLVSTRLASFEPAWSAIEVDQTLEP